MSKPRQAAVSAWPLFGGLSWEGFSHPPRHQLFSSQELTQNSSQCGSPMVLSHTSPHGELTNHFDRPTRSLRLQDFVCSQWPAAPLMHLEWLCHLPNLSSDISQETSSNFTTHRYWHRACINFCHPRFPAVAASSSSWIRWFHDMLTLVRLFKVCFMVKIIKD